MTFRIPSIVALMFLVTALGEVVWAGAGRDGGACSVATPSGTWVLKDFVRTQSLSRLNSRLANSSSTQGAQIRMGVVGQTIGFEIMDGTSGAMDFKQTSAFQAAIEDLGKWRTDSPGLVGLLEEALSGMQFVGVDRLILPIARGCRDQNDHPIFVYDPQLGFAFASVPAFNRLDGVSQKLAIIREGFRVLIGQARRPLMPSDVPEEVSERILSQMTSLMAFGVPVERRNQLEMPLQRGGFAVEETRRIREINSYISKACQAASRVSVNCGRPLPQVMSLSDQAHLREVYAQIRVINSNLTQKFDQAANDRIQLQAYDALSELYPAIMILNTIHIGAVLESPSLQLSLTALQNINRSLATCLQTREGDSCHLNGITAIRSVSLDIFEGRHRQPFEWTARSNVERMRSHFDQLAPAMFRP